MARRHTADGWKTVNDLYPAENQDAMPTALSPTRAYFCLVPEAKPLAPPCSKPDMPMTDSRSIFRAATYRFEKPPRQADAEQELTRFCLELFQQLLDLGYQLLDSKRLRDYIVLESMSVKVLYCVAWRLTMPASMAVFICSLLALAVTAMIGMWRLNLPSFSKRRISFVHVKPSMTGISAPS